MQRYRQGESKECRTKSNHKEAGLATQTSDKTDFKTQSVTGNKEGYFTEGPIHQEVVTVINICTYQHRAKICEAKTDKI